MTTKHTAGPWKYDDNKIVSTTEFGPRYEEDEPNPIVVVNLIGAMGGNDVEADAQLIAAAPELLAALMHVSKIYASEIAGRGIVSNEGETWRIIQNAIKTAVKQ